MASMQQFSVTRQGKTFRVAGRVYGDDQQLVADFTGANDVLFPQVMNDLPDAQVDALGRLLGHWLLLTLSGLQP